MKVPVKMKFTAMKLVMQQHVVQRSIASGMQMKVPVKVMIMLIVLQEMSMAMK